jgi:hypothetical protein
MAVRLINVLLGIAVWGPWAGRIGKRRGHSFWFGYPFGLVIGLIGVAIVRFLPHGSRQVEPPGPPAPTYDTAGWDQVVAAASALPMNQQQWVRSDLAARQERGQLMAAVIGRRVRYPDDPGEPAGLLIYPNVVVAASGQSASYLRPGVIQVVDAVVEQAGLEEVTALTVHIVELGPPSQRSSALEVLRSLPWVTLRELSSNSGI